LKIADLFISLGLSGQGDVKKGLDNVSSSLKELFSMSIRTKLTLAGIVSGLTAAAFSAGKTGAAFMHFKNAFNLSPAELQKWQYASLQLGVSAENMQGSIEGIQDALANARLGGGYSDVFGKLGIDISGKKDAFNILSQIQSRIKSGNTDAMRIWSSGLVNTELFQFLKRGPDMEKFKAPKGAILSESQLRQQERISVAFGNFSNNLKKSLDSFIVDNSQTIMETIKFLQDTLLSFMNFLKDNKTEIRQAIVAMESLSASLASFVGAFSKGVLGTVTNATREAAASGHGPTASVLLGMNAPFAKLGNWMIDGAVDAIKNTLTPGHSYLTTGPATPLQFQQSKEAMPKPPLEKSMYVEEGKNQMVFYFNGAQFGNELKDETKQDFSRAIRLFRGGV